MSLIFQTSAASLSRMKRMISGRRKFLKLTSTVALFRVVIGPSPYCGSPILDKVISVSCAL